jgi:hypothetical protein
LWPWWVSTSSTLFLFTWIICFNFCIAVMGTSSLYLLNIPFSILLENLLWNFCIMSSYLILERISLLWSCLSSYVFLLRSISAIGLVVEMAEKSLLQILTSCSYFNNLSFISLSLIVLGGAILTSATLFLSNWVKRELYLPTQAPNSLT